MSLRARAEAMAREAVRIAALLRIAPQLALRLSLAPTRDVHAVAAFLEAQAAAGMPLEAMAAAIGSSDPRALLDRALPGRDARLFRALDRAILPAWSVEEIAALDEVIRSDIADTLGTAGGITRTNLAAARLLLSSHPVLRRTRAHITDAWTRQRLTAVLVWLQGQGTLRSLGATPEGAGASKRR